MYINYFLTLRSYGTHTMFILFGVSWFFIRFAKRPSVHVRFIFYIINYATKISIIYQI